MNERQKRLIEVYDYVRQHFGIHTKQGVAEALNYGRTSMSAALNGNEGYLTDSLFKSICAAFPGTFNLDYLLTGEGSLLVDEGSAKVQDTDSGELEALKNRVKLLEEQVAHQRQIIDHYETFVELALSENRQLKQTIDNPFVSDKTPASAYDPPAKK
jgi:MoxR-like ATPase